MTVADNACYWTRQMTFQTGMCRLHPKCQITKTDINITSLTMRTGTPATTQRGTSTPTLLFSSFDCCQTNTTRYTGEIMCTQNPTSISLSLPVLTQHQNKNTVQ